MKMVVGIDRKIRRVWMDDVVDRLVSGADGAELRRFLNEYLLQDLPGKESRAKTIGIILRIWGGVPRARINLVDQSVGLVPLISGQERLWLHWGMASLAYPFFRDTVQVVGRLLTLQGDFSNAQLQTRMMTTWGDRATIKEAVQKLIATLVDWGVIQSTGPRGRFISAAKMTTGTSGLQIWLLEALLTASAAAEIDIQQLLRLPELFPFAMSVGVGDLRRHQGFNIDRQGLDMDIVSLRPIKAVPATSPTTSNMADADKIASPKDSSATKPGKSRKRKVSDLQGILL